MRCSVVVCTLNRAALLGETLAGLAALDPPPPGTAWEIVLVDNGSTDATPEVARRHAAAGLPLTYLVEPGWGLSRARNRALEAATGDLLLWTDDDVLVDPAWLRAHAEAALTRPDAAFLGGPVLPRFLEPPPGWIARNLEVLGSAYALRDLGPADHPITRPEDAPFGANMAVRRRAFERGLRFDPALGRRGGDLLSGEETDLFRRLLAAGETGAWVAGARVRHAIPPARATRRYLADYYYWNGRGEARAGVAPELAHPRRKLERRHRRARRAHLLGLRRDPAWARAFATAHRLRGVLDELAGREGG